MIYILHHCISICFVQSCQWYWLHMRDNRCLAVWQEGIDMKWPGKMWSRCLIKRFDNQFLPHWGHPADPGWLERLKNTRNIFDILKEFSLRISLVDSCASSRSSSPDSHPCTLRTVRCITYKIVDTTYSIRTQSLSSVYLAAVDWKDKRWQTHLSTLEALNWGPDELSTPWWFLPGHKLKYPALSTLSSLPHNKMCEGTIMSPPTPTQQMKNPTHSAALHYDPLFAGCWHTDALLLHIQVNNTRRILSCCRLQVRHKWTPQMSAWAAVSLNTYALFVVFRMLHKCRKVSFLIRKF